MQNNRHCLSDAFGRAASRLLREDCILSEEKVSDLVEKLRVGLSLDNQNVVASMMFFQFIVRECPDVGVIRSILASHSLGIKLGTEGFYTSDIYDHVTKEVSVKDIRLIEGYTVKNYVFDDIENRQIKFRNAMINVAIEIAGNKVYNMSGYANSPRATDPYRFHVVVVDDDNFICSAHSTMVMSICPDAKVKCFDSIKMAKEYICGRKTDRVDLVLLDRVMPVEEGMKDEFENGVKLASFLKLEESKLKTEFSARPLVALITSHPVQNLQCDGSYSFCDAHIEKPLTRQSLSVLMQAACA